MGAALTDAVGCYALPALVILALDPGLNIGIAMVCLDGTVRHLNIITLNDLRSLNPLPSVTIVIGNGTGSDRVQGILRKQGLSFAVVEEAGTSLEARELFFRDHPPKGLAKLLPRGLRFPPRAIDDYAAYAIALRFLSSERQMQEAMHMQAKASEALRDPL